MQRSLAKRLRVFMRQASDDEQLQMHTLQVTWPSVQPCWNLQALCSTSPALFSSDIPSQSAVCGFWELHATDAPRHLLEDP